MALHQTSYIDFQNSPAVHSRKTQTKAGVLKVQDTMEEEGRILSKDRAPYMGSWKWVVLERSGDRQTKRPWSVSPRNLNFIEQT